MSGASFSARVITAALSLVSLPLVLHSLGPERFGTYAVIASIPSLGGFLDAGLGAGVRTAVAESAATEGADARTALVSGTVMLGWVSAALAVVALPVVVLVDWGAVTGDVGTPAREQRWAAALVTVLFLASLPMLAAARSLEGIGLAHLVAFASVVPSVTLLAGAVALRAFDVTGVLPYTGTLGLGAPLTGLVLSVIALRRLPRSQKRRVCADAAVVRLIWSTGWPMLIVGLALSISYSTDPMVVGSVLGQIAAGQYSVAARLSQLVTLVIYSTAPVLWSHYVRTRAAGHRVESSEVFRVSRGYGLVAVAIGVPFGLAGPLVSRLWTSNDINAPAALFWGFATWSVVLAIQLPMAMSLNSARDLRFQACTTSAMAAANLPLSILLARWLGVSGPVWSSAFCLLILHTAPMTIRLRGRDRSSHLVVA